MRKLWYYDFPIYEGFLIMNSTGNTMTTAKIRREDSTASTHRELTAPSSTKLLVPNNPGAWIIGCYLFWLYWLPGIIQQDKG